MSKKDIIKRYKGGLVFENGKEWYVGRWLKKYLKTRTTKRKHRKNYDD